MLYNYFKIAWRNLIKDPFYSLINIAGLALGLMAVFFIFLYVKDELSFDQYNKNVNQLYRLNFFANLGEQAVNTSSTPAAAGPLFSPVFPEVKASCRIYTGYGDYLVKNGLKAFKESRIASVDSTFGDLFTVQVLAGDLKAALSHPGHVVMTRSAYKKYFPSLTNYNLEDVKGKILTFENELPYYIGAIIEDMPQNGHFQFDMLLPMIDNKASNEENWGSTNYHTYFLLQEDASVANLSDKMNALFKEKFTLVLKEYLNVTWDDFVKQGNFARIELFMVQKIHLFSNLDEEFLPPGQIKQVYIFCLIGVVILLLACINFVNLSTARASLRAREVGVRKAIGAVRSALAAQFLAESVLFSILSGILALGFMKFVMPIFNQIAGKSFSFSLVFQSSIFIPVFMITLIAGLVAGIYPALYLSSLQPVKVLKGLALSGKKSFFRNGLVVFQFFVSITLIIGSVTIYRQIKYMQDRKIGFNKEQVLIINNFYLVGKNDVVFRDGLSAIPEVKSMTVSNFLPGSVDRNASAITAGRVATADNSILTNNWWADRDFIRTMEFKIIQGRDFDKNIQSDSAGVVINEVLAKSFGYPFENIVGKILGLPGDGGKINEYHILGVMSDFNFMSLQHRIEPLAIFNGGGYQYLSVRLNTNDLPLVINKLNALWQTLAPGIPFDFTFMDARYNQLYQSEQKSGKVSLVFSFFAIFIACIGLLGLATFTIHQRIKEIGIRKVLGASAKSILGLMAKDFLAVILIAICFAFPFSWYLMHAWLMGFEYRTDVSVWVLLGTGLGILVMAMIIVMVQSMRATMVNPVKSLKSE